MAFRHYQLRGYALGAHMMAATAGRAPEPCRHCQKFGCSCGQEDASKAVEMARALPMPTGTANAEREAHDFTRSIPSVPLTRAALQGLAMAAGNLAAHHALGRRTVDVEACRAVEQAARAAAAKMP